MTDDEKLEHLNAIFAGADLRARTDKFAPKLTFDKQCAAYAAMWQMHVPVWVIAKYFSLNKSTVRYLSRSDSPKYKKVRDTAGEMGKVAFVAEYLTDEIAKGLTAVANQKEPERTKVEPTHDKDAGWHTLPNGIEAHVLLDMENLLGPGWYVEDPKVPGLCGPHHTSTLALNYAKKEFI
jgi:hypothetical protein